MGLDRTDALRRECDELSRFCAGLTDSEWRTESAAAGWRVQDVVAHVGGSLHSLFTPAALALVTSNDIERTNDDFVDRRRDWEPARVLAEFDRWRGRVVWLTGAVTRTPLARLPMPLGELGRFPLALVLGGALVFDQHTHLRHDIAPALGRTAPGTDEPRMTAVLDWMFAVLANQLRAARPAWLDRPLAISLAGPGGATWRVGVGGGITRDPGRDAVAQVSAPALGFPSWATRRSPWREHDVRIAGDEEYGGRFLDAVNVV